MFGKLVFEGKALSLKALGVSFALASASVAHAEVLTNPAQMSPCARVVDFESFAAGPLPNRISVGDVTFTATRGLGILDLTGFFPDNRRNVVGKCLQPCATDGTCVPDYAALRIAFTQPVTEVGLGWFDPNFEGNTIRAYDARGGLLETAAPALFPPGQGFDTFIGIRRGMPEIAYIDIVPANGGDVFTIDNVYYAGLPVITQQPGNVTSCLLGAVTFEADALGTAPLTWQWFKGRQPVVDTDRITGSQTRTLRFRRTAFSDENSYSCVVTAPCGSASTLAATLRVCAANVDDGSGTGRCDGGVTIDDLLFYLFLYERGDIRADVDDGSSTGTQDGGVTVDDMIYYIGRFEAGC